MATIVIVGAGLGGMSMAYEMRENARKTDRIVMISDKDYFHFAPSNPSVAVDWRKPDDIKIPLTDVLPKRNVEVIVSALTRVDPKARKVILADDSSVEYDHLILSTGPRLAFGEVEGLGPDNNGQANARVFNRDQPVLAILRGYTRDPDLVPPRVITVFQRV